MFYDNFTEGQICGIFTPWHFVAICVFFWAIAMAVYFSRSFNQKQMKKTLLIIAILVTIMEIIKIGIRTYKQPTNYDSYISLYFCSIFVVAIWLSLCKNKIFQNMGLAFITMGGIVAAICFVIYPSTSLPFYPIWHPASLHSLFYHWLMLYCGIMVLKTKFYVPNIKHFWNYFLLVTFCCILAEILNIQLGTNFMFMGYPFALDFLQGIFDFSPNLYAFLAYLTQSVVIFLGSFVLYKLAEYFIAKQTTRKEKQKSV